MTDMHVHVGQFNDLYYDYQDVLSVVKKCGIKKIILAYITPKFLDPKIAIDFLYSVNAELVDILHFAQLIQLEVNCLYWVDPLVLQSKISMEDIFQDFDFFGIAIHPGVHNWIGEYQEELMQVFEFAKKESKPVFIHTGDSSYDNPLQFEDYFSNFPEIEIHLAHCKAADSIIKLFTKYRNLYGDTAFCPIESYRKICEAGFKERMLFGSDFPISHYWKNYGMDSKIVKIEDLEKEYKQILEEKLLLNIP